MSITRNNIIILIIALTGFFPQAHSEILCRPYQLVEANQSGPQAFSEGLLWKISQDGTESGYVFGTIHIDDKDVLSLPDAVLQGMGSSDNFLMEVVPEPDDALEMSMSMFFMDGSRLIDVLDSEIFTRTTEILSTYGFTEEMVMVMKPWAAYIIMSYPQNTGEILDFKLLNMARLNGANIYGLETASEQIKIFSDLSLNDQARLLTDTVCHYETTKSDFEEIKEFYLDRDLDALYSFSNKYSFGDDSVYERIALQLITQRNLKMVEKIIDYFQSGITFVAVGAMHLPGEDGILNLLKLENYEIQKVY